MAINFKLVRRDLVPVGEDDSMGRTWAGWDDSATLEEIWEVNRGQWVVNGERLRAERYATMSFEGVIRLVAEIEGSWTDPEGYRVLEGEVLPGSHPVSAALVGKPLEGGRNPVSYFNTTDLEATEAGPPRAVLLTVNPARYDFYAIEAPEVQAAIALGRAAPGTWSVANRVQGIGPGDVVYLLQQGKARRGIIASGTVESAIFLDDHWDPEVPGQLRYIEVSWTAIVDEEELLPLAQLQSAFPEQHWTPRSSGESIRDSVVDRLASMWATHVGRAVAEGAAPSPSAGAGQGRVIDAQRRKQIEDAAQDRLMKHFRDRGWHVQDCRYTEPYDALATKGDQRRYLEAKGTMGSGDTVVVTRNEVRHARNHPGECVLGVMTFLRLDGNGDIDPDSGEFWIGPFEPDAGLLSPISYDFQTSWEQFSPWD